MARQKESFIRKMGMVVLSLPLLLLILPVLLLCAVFYWMYRITLYFLIWLSWLRNGKNVLFIYSDSPIWHEYMTTQILPLVENRAVVLNWSERKSWKKWSLAVRVFHLFSSGNDFNPAVMLFRPFRSAESFQFFSAFKEWKHGNTKKVERQRSELMRAL
jgi:hypothetical protein